MTASALLAVGTHQRCDNQATSRTEPGTTALDVLQGFGRLMAMQRVSVGSKHKSYEVIELVFGKRGPLPPDISGFGLTIRFGDGIQYIFIVNKIIIDDVIRLHVRPEDIRRDFAIAIPRRDLILQFQGHCLRRSFGGPKSLREWIHGTEPYVRVHKSELQRWIDRLKPISFG